MNGLWKINGKDTFATWGVALTRGSYASILSRPTPKKRLEHDYTDADGVEVDTTTPLTYDFSRYKIKVVIIGKTFANFWANYNAFFTEIDKAQSFTLFIHDLGVTVNLLYEGATQKGSIGTLRSGKKAIAFELSVFEPNPKNRIYVQ